MGNYTMQFWKGWYESKDIINFCIFLTMDVDFRYNCAAHVALEGLDNMSVGFCLPTNVLIVSLPNNLSA